MTTIRLTASECFQRTKEAISKEATEELEDIYKAIEVAIVEQQYNVYWYDALNFITKQTLETDGFNISETSRNNEHSVTISWREPKED